MKLDISIGGKRFKNPVWVASGTFGYGKEYADFLDLKEVGAIVAKTVTLDPREGNPVPRIVETPSGLLNSIGLENSGIDKFIEEGLPFLRKTGTSFIVSVAGKSEEEFVECVQRLEDADGLDGIELNLSCPNVKHGGTKCRLMSQDPEATESVVRSARKITKRLLIAKLTPNVTDIAVIADSAEAGGADAVALVNTYFGMAVDSERMTPVLGNLTGGLSGPAIKPMALRAVWDVYHKVKIPVIGIGGIMTGIDVAEFMLCGASAVEVGTANLVDPDSHTRILGEFKAYLKRHDIRKAAELTGKLRTN